MEQQFYEQIKRILSEARNKVYQTAVERERLSISQVNSRTI